MNTYTDQPAASSASQPAQFQVMPTANGHTLLLSNAEFPIYHLHMARFLAAYQPHDQREADLVQRITDNEWRIDRVNRLEMGFYAKGQLEFGHLFSEHDPNTRALLIEVHTHNTYARHFNSLSLQESRLRRYVEKDTAELLRLQTERKEQALEKEKESAAQTAAATSAAKTATAANAAPQNGFEFSDSPSTGKPKSNSKTPGYTNGKVTRH